MNHLGDMVSLGMKYLGDMVSLEMNHLGDMVSLEMNHLGDMVAYRGAVKALGGDLSSLYLVSIEELKRVFFLHSSSLFWSNEKTPVSLQTSEEVMEKMSGLQVPMNSERGVAEALDLGTPKLPKSIDYRKKGMVTPVKNQVRLKPTVSFSHPVGEIFKVLAQCRCSFVAVKAFSRPGS